MRNLKLLTLASAVAFLVAACGEEERAADEGPMEAAGKTVGKTVGKTLDTAAATAKRALDDAYLHTRARVALLDGIGADAMRVEIDAAGDTVTLRGAVRERASKELARELVENLDGVTAVHDEITHEPGGSDDPGALEEARAEIRDAVLAAKVRLALLDAVGADALGVDIDAAGGTVVLSGTVDHAAAMEAAAKAAEAVEGVTSLENDLKAGDS